MGRWRCLRARLFAAADGAECADGAEEVGGGNAFEQAAGSEGEVEVFGGVSDGVRGEQQEAGGVGRRAEAEEVFAVAGGEDEVVEEDDVDGVSGEEGEGFLTGGELGEDTHVGLAVEDDAPAEAFEGRGEGEEDADGRGGRVAGEAVCGLRQGEESA